MSAETPEERAIRLMLRASEIDVNALLESVSRDEKRAAMDGDAGPYITAMGSYILYSTFVLFRDEGPKDADQLFKFGDLIMRAITVAYRLGKEDANG